MTDYSAFKDPPYPPQPRRLEAPETFEGVVQSVTVRQVRRAQRDERYVLAFTLDPIDAGLADASFANAQFIHDEIQAYVRQPDDRTITERLRAIENARAQHQHAIERAKPVGIIYLFDASRPDIWKARSIQVGDIARAAHGDAFGDEVAGLLTGHHPDNEHPFQAPGQYTQSSGGVWIEDEEPRVMRMLNELRGLRFIVNAERDPAGPTYTVYSWMRMRA